jgi:hypothetical protein
MNIEDARKLLDFVFGTKYGDNDIEFADFGFWDRMAFSNDSFCGSLIESPTNGILLTFDHIVCFNKEGHNPISAVDSFKGRKLKRLKQAIEHLATNKGQDESNNFAFEDNWDEFGQHNRAAFYS